MTQTWGVEGISCGMLSHVVSMGCGNEARFCDANWRMDSGARVLAGAYCPVTNKRVIWQKSGIPGAGVAVVRFVAPLDGCLLWFYS